MAGEGSCGRVVEIDVDEAAVGRPEPHAGVFARLEIRGLALEIRPALFDRHLRAWPKADDLMAAITQALNLGKERLIGIN
jgi:hypothetical protein